MCHTHVNRQDALTERLFQGTIAALELFGVYLGKELGLYRALSEHGASSAPELAERAGIHPRYAREWLEQQAVAGFLFVDDEAAAPDARRYRMPVEHAGVLAEAEHPAHVAPFSQMLVGIAQVLPQVAQAYRSGEGVPYADYGKDFRAGQGGINRPAFNSDLVEAWLHAVPGLRARLSAGEPVRITDVGCGEGWASIAIAEAFPEASVVGFDLDEASIAAAKQHARDRGVNVEFVCGDAGEISGDASFDLVVMLETLHDLSQPTRVLAGVRRMLTSAGHVLIADERVAECFTAPGDEIERMMYGWSISHCLPASMAEPGSAAIGTAIRPETVKTHAGAAGFSACDVTDIDDDLFRFYLLRR